MTWQNMALVAAGAIGGATAIIHGILLQRLVIRRIEALLGANDTILRRLLPSLLHFTTFNWLLSGLALIAAALWFGGEARLVASFFAGSSFLFGGLGALWGTRRPHPGWIPMFCAVALIVLGAMPAVGAPV